MKDQERIWVQLTSINITLLEITNVLRNNPRLLDTEVRNAIDSIRTTISMPLENIESNIDIPNQN